MKHARPMLLAVSTLALLISACSQPADVQAPGLEPQFGGTGFSVATSVALDRAGNGIYVAGLSEAPGSSQGGSAPFVTRFNRDGFQRWVKNFGGAAFDRAVATEADGAGNAYVLWWELIDDDRFGDGYRYYLRKYTRSGGFVWQKALSYTDTNPADLALDPAGNVLVTGTDGRGEHERSFVRKYSASGRLLWQRTPAAGRPASVVITDDGSVYVAGLTRQFDSVKLSKFSAAGKARWTRNLEPGDVELAAYGDNTVYTAVSTFREDDSSSVVGYDIVVRPYSGSTGGWTQTISLEESSILGGLAVSENGNLFVAGSLVPRDGEPDVTESGFVRKFSRTGAIIFTQSFDVSPDATFTRTEGIAALTGGELYLVGVSGRNSSVEAFIRRADSRGNEV